MVYACPRGERREAVMWWEVPYSVEAVVKRTAICDSITVTR
jgi:hypothetical protein